MSGRYLTDLADVCRRAGLAVVEVDGWQTRARGSGGYSGTYPWCVMWHHTASDTTPANDVSYIINAPDAPLANLYLARDGTVHVCAAGATNTNGKGGPLTMSKGVVPLDRMNEAAIGIEAANDGVGGPWAQVQVDAYFTLSLALTAAYGLQPTDMATHAEWAPGRKIDPARATSVAGPWRPASINSSGTWSCADIRNELTRRNTAPTPEPPTPTPEEAIVHTVLSVDGDKFAGPMDANGICTPIEWLTPERYETYLRLGAPEVVRSRGDLGGCTILGATPPGYADDVFANVIR